MPHNPGYPSKRSPEICSDPNLEARPASASLHYDLAAAFARVPSRQSPKMLSTESTNG